MNRVSRSRPGRFTWVGRIGGDDVVLAVKDGAVHGSIQADGRIFEIETLPRKDAMGNWIQRIAELDMAAFQRAEREDPTCGQDEEVAESGPATAAPETGSNPGTGPGAAGPVIDVMVLYDKATKDKNADMDVYLASLINLSNQIYRNSAVPQTIRLVHHQHITSGITGNHNSWMRENDSVAALRDAHGADLVVMIVDAGMSSCGVATSGYSTTKRSCALGNKTFTHELGHNMGARHAWEQFTSHSGYAYGYINHAKSWRTVMSYSECEDGGRCSRIAHFSNPDVLYNGDRTGVKDSMDNARMLRSRSLAVSNNRPTKAPVGIGQRRTLIEETPGFSVRLLAGGLLELQVKQPDFLALAWVGLDGRRVPLQAGWFEAGKHRLDWNPVGAGTGVGYLRVQGRSGRALWRLIPSP